MITVEQIEDLANLWGEKSHSQVIIRCIEKVWGSFVSSQEKQNDIEGEDHGRKTRANRGR